MIQPVRFFVAVLALLPILLAFTTSSASAADLSPEVRVAERGGAVLTVALIDQRIEEMPKAIRSDFLNDPDRMARLIDGMLLTLQLANEAEKKGIVVPAEEAGDTDLARRTALANALMTTVVRDVSEEQLLQIARERFQVEKQNYSSSPSYTLRHLKVSTEKYGDVAAKLVAENARRRIVGGEDFDVVAKEFVDPDAPAEFSGDIPLTDLLHVDPVIRTSLAPLKDMPGLTEVFEGGGGYNLIELVKLNPAVEVTFDAVRDQLISDIRSEVEQQTRTTYMKAFVLMPATLNDEAVQQLPSRYFDAAASAADGKD